MNPHKQSIRTIAQIAFIVGITVAAYSNTLKVPFFFDDTNNIVTNPVIKSLSNFTSLERLTDISSYASLDAKTTNLIYAIVVRPVTYFTFALNYAVGDDNTFGYHVVNIAIHLANSLLVFFLIRVLLSTPIFSPHRSSSNNSRRSVLEEWAPFFTAALFACHPLQTQAVTYITQRFASLAAAFYLGAVLCHVRGRLGERPLGLRIGALALALLAMMSKELSATLPAVLLLIEIVFFNSSFRSAARRVWPFFLTVAVIPLLMLYVSHRIGTESIPAMIARGQNVSPPLDYFLTQTTVVVMYLGLLLWPMRLNFDYDYPLHHSLAEPMVIACSLFLLVFLGSALILLVKARRRSSGSLAAVAFGMLWFLITLSVESSFVPLADLAEEYRCYLPSAGFFMAVVIATLAAIERRPILVHRTTIAGFGVIALLLAIAAQARNDVYRSEVTLWEDVVAKSPLKPRPHTNLSVAYAKAGREEDSILQYQAAALLNPDFRVAHGGVGVKQEEFEEMMHSAASRFVQDHLTKGMAALDKGDFGQAETEFRAALKLDPGRADAHSNLGFIYLRRREFEEAIRENREAVRLAPKRPDLLRNLGFTLHWAGKTAEALEVFKQAVAVDPADAESKKMIEQLLKRQ